MVRVDGVGIIFFTVISIVLSFAAAFIVMIINVRYYKFKYKDNIKSIASMDADGVTWLGRFIMLIRGAFIGYVIVFALYGIFIGVLPIIRFILALL